MVLADDVVKLVAQVFVGCLSLFGSSMRSAIVIEAVVLKLLLMSHIRYHYGQLVIVCPLLKATVPDDLLCALIPILRGDQIYQRIEILLIRCVKVELNLPLAQVAPV